MYEVRTLQCAVCCIPDCSGIRPDAAIAEFRSEGLAAHAWAEPEFHGTAESLLHTACFGHQGLYQFMLVGGWLWE